MLAQILLATLVLLLFIAVVRAALRPVVVYEFERGLRYARGKFTGILAPGVYWPMQPLSEVRKVDIRPVFAVVPGQEVLSADGVALKVSLAAKYEVVDPAAAVNTIENFRDALHVELQLALRQIIGGTAIDDLLAQRQSIGAKLHDIVSAKATSFGLKLLAVEIRDIMFPGELKKIFTQVAQEAATRASAEIQAKEKELVEAFRQKGLTITEVNKDDFKDAVMKNVSLESLGYRKADYDKIQALKAEGL